MSRRTFLLGVGAGLVGGCARQLEPLALPGTAETPPLRRLTPLAERAAPDADAARLPVVDFHTHIQKSVTPEMLVGMMDWARVTRMVLMPLYYGDGPGPSVNDGEGSDEQALDFARRYPDKFVPFVGMQRQELNNAQIWHQPNAVARRLVAETDAKLRSGQFFGMGELMLRFYPYTNRHGIVAPSDMDYPADSYLMRTFADLSARYRAPMVVHAEAEPGVLDAMVRLLEKHPEALVVWSHNCGRASAQTIGGLFGRFRNLHADLGGMVYSAAPAEHYGNYWPRRTPWMHLVMDPQGGLLPEMKALFEAFPDRFVIGTDVAHARVYTYYADHLPRWRALFSQLSPEAARKFAYGNADRLLSRSGK